MNEELEKKCIKLLVWSITIEDTGFDFNIDLEKNVNKLKQRFPEKFTKKKALNMDLNAERKILEA